MHTLVMTALLQAVAPSNADLGVRAAESCGHTEICGPKNPEDMIRVRGTRWALVSRLGRDPHAPGGFSLVDLSALTSRVLTPHMSKPAAAEYAACPGAPAASNLITHGLDIRQLAHHSIEVCAVNHGGRDSIEVFELKVKDDDVEFIDFPDEKTI
jgi:hypothetical protein